MDNNLTKIGESINLCPKFEEKPLKKYTYEEAIEEVGVGKFHYALLLISGLCFMACITEISGIGLIMFSIKCDLKFTLVEQGLIGSAGFLGIVISSHFMGFLADTWGRVRSLRLMLFLSLCMSIISVMSVNVWMLFIFRFLTGCFISGGQAIVFTVVGEFHSSKTRIKHVALVSIFLSVGIIYFPALAIGILPMNIDSYIGSVHLLPWRLLMFCNTFPSMMAVLGVLWLPETPKYLLGQGNHSDCVEVLRKVYSINTGNPRSSYPCDIVTLKDKGSDLSNIKGLGNALLLIWNQTVQVFTKDRIWQTFNMCFITFVINLIAQGTFMYFPIIINNLITHVKESLTVCKAFKVVDSVNSNSTLEEICADPDSMNIKQYEYLAYIGCLFMMFYLIMSAVINHTGKKLLLIIWLGSAAICSISLHWIHELVLVLLFMTVTVAIANCIGIMSAVALEFYPTNINAMGVSFVMMIGRVGAVVGTNIVGPLLFSYCDELFFAYGIVIAVVCVCAYFLPNGSSK